MKKTSKYLNKTFDNNWVCIHVGVARTQAVYLEGNRQRYKRPHHQSYYYIFERPTSDGLANKQVRLDAVEAAKVYRGELLVEDIADERQAKGIDIFKSKVSYHFIGK